MFRKLALIAVLAAPSLALAEEAKPYEVKAPAVTVKTGDNGKLSILIATKEGAHISEDAPLSITVASDGLQIQKTKLASADAVEGKGASPRFEVPFVAGKAGDQTATANLKFVVCTKELCARETETVTIAVAVK